MTIMCRTRILTIVAVAVFASAIGQVQAGTVTVPNSGFELIYKPGQTVITGVISSGGWTQGVGPDCPIDTGQYNFSDASSGTVADIAGWLGYDRAGWIAWGGTYGRDQTTGNLQGSVSNQGNHTPGGSNCYLANGGGWSNPAGGLIVSNASLGNVQSEAIYTLSMYAKGSATPVVLNLLANGVVVTPTSSVSPVLTGDWQAYSRTYNDVTLSSYVGQAMTIVLGVGRNASGTQSHFDDVSLSSQILGPPGQATNPNPANGAPDVWPDSNLSWTAGDSAESSNVYFGTDPTPDSGEFKGNRTGTTYDPGTMAENTTYYWRIDSVNTYDTTTGVVWSFTTGEFPSGDLASVMTALTNHIAGTTPLSGPQIETLTASFEANKAGLDDTTAIMAQAFALVDYYDTIVGPLFINAETSGGFPRVQGGSDGYELERAIFAVQQAIIDVIYTPANCQTYQTFLDGKMFETSDFFPGACTPPVDPEVSYEVAINASNPTMWGKPVCYGPIPARRPTGVYLAPGSIGEVTVPSAMVNHGFKIQVGAHAVDKYAYYKDTLQRLDRVTTSFPITSTVTSIANPLGGGVYIMVPYEANLGIQTVEIANVVQSPFFSATSFHQTTLQEWTNTERHHPGPWADFESDKFMMNVPTSWIYAYADPVSQMADWDLAMDAVSELIGYASPHNIRNTVVLYVQPDLSIQHGAYGTGYPQINHGYNPNDSTNGNSSHFWLTNVMGWSTEFHELSHCQLFSKFPGHEEAMVNLPYVYVASEKFGIPLVDAFTDSMQLGYLENIDVDQAALTWFVTENFRNGRPMDLTDSEYNEVRYQHRGYGRYVEIGTLFGWDKLSDFYYQEQLDYISPPPSDGLEYTDSRIFRLSKAIGYDITPLIHCWGVHPENPGDLHAAMAGEGLQVSQAFHDRLIHYKDIIPADNAEFWDHYLTIYPSQPEGGNPLYQYGWYNVWKYIYDTEEGTAAKAAMQYIIDLYYDPDVTPPTPDPMTWSSVPAAAGDSSITMTASVATDDLNDVEYYFTCTGGGGHDSGWQANNSYTDIGLSAGTQYTYTVTARDTSNNYNATAPSIAESATTDADAGAPSPNPATFASAPTAVSDTEITMTATTGADGTGPVKYFFDEISGNPGGTDSGWVTNPVYNDTGLAPQTQYTYTVQMRDALLNTGAVSLPSSFTTAFAGSITVTVPNSGFETIYKPGQTVITATLSGWSQGVGPDCPIDVGQYNFSDATSGTLADIPGWLGYDMDGWVAFGCTYDRDRTNVNLQGSVSTGNNTTPGGANCYLVNGADWGNPAGGLITSAASLGNIQGNATYILSMYANGSATPIVLKLLANGVEVMPTSSVDPVLGGGHQEFSRRYDVADLTSYVGHAITIVCGIGRDAEGVQSHIDDVSLKYYELPGRGDTDFDGRINLVDFAWLAANWLDNSCNAGNNFCSGADIDRADGVGLDDLLILTEHWMEGVSDLVARWRLDESYGMVVSDSVEGNDGTIKGNPTWRPSDGKIGGALEFDGVGDYVEVEGYKGISGSNARTITAWVKAESNGSTLSIVRWGTMESSGALWSNVINTEGKLRVAVWGGSVVGDTIINDNTWHHVAIVLPDKEGVKVEDIRLYVDGGREDTTVSNGAQTINTAVGIDVLISLDDSDGLLDDVRIYNYAVPEYLIAEMINLSLIAHWQFDESSGTVASDIVEGHNGTLNGDPTWQPSGGKIGGALEFDGVGDYVEIEGYKGISGSNARTVTAWVRAESNGSALSIVRWGTLAINGGLWSNVINADGKLRAAVLGGSIVGDTVIDDNTWHHVAIVLPDKENVVVRDILLYVDGEQEGTIISNGTQIIDTAVDMDVLISLDGSVGLLDDVRIYNYALSEGEIGSLADVL